MQTTHIAFGALILAACGGSAPPAAAPSETTTTSTTTTAPAVDTSAAATPAAPAAPAATTETTTTTPASTTTTTTSAAPAAGEPCVAAKDVSASKDATACKAECSKLDDKAPAGSKCIPAKTSCMSQCTTKFPVAAKKK